MTDTDNYDELLLAVRSQKVAQEINKTVNATSPETPVDVAHLLIQNSATTELMPEVDKSLILSNLDPVEKFQVFTFIMTYQDYNWLKREQQKKDLESLKKYEHLRKNYPDFFTDEDYIKEIEDYLDEGVEAVKIYDKADLLRMGLYIPSLSRGKDGFERTKQVETISRSTIESQDKTEKKPGFLGGIFGGFKK